MKVGQPQISRMMPNTQPSDQAQSRLKKVCREFESLLVARLLHAMRETVPKVDLFGSREKEEIFRAMLDEEIAKQVSSTGAFKLGDIAYAQLLKLENKR